MRRLACRCTSNAGVKRKRERDDEMSPWHWGNCWARDTTTSGKRRRRFRTSWVKKRELKSQGHWQQNSHNDHSFYPAFRLAPHAKTRIDN
ncbi:hypothetical protein SUGI_1493940 [Cryptomeria japonica]|uniref:Uncharacterized protein n=1 Tax=Cryptomeria japonica TaxID=3369 RepID=A0AAD3NSZ5_CRYJA|nr:hypothetical protein SUGI_1373610 [Cryptomeria japonica]GLJ59136.1 hypothetical protein SUGI_1493940 [Cryptomeria japonica]